MRWSRFPLALALTAFSLTGCGGSGQDSAPLSDLDGAEQFAMSFDDMRSVPASLSKAFATGSAPSKEDMAKFAKYMVEPAGKPKSEGGKVTILMKILDAKDQKEIGQKEWELVKEDKGWKVKSAPLP